MRVLLLPLLQSQALAHSAGWSHMTLSPGDGSTQLLCTNSTPKYLDLHQALMGLIIAKKRRRTAPLMEEEIELKPDYWCG